MLDLKYPEVGGEWRGRGGGGGGERREGEMGRGELLPQLHLSPPTGSEINKQIILKSLEEISKFSFHQANQIFSFIIQVGRID